MGFKDFDDAIKDKLKSAGIDLKENPDEEAFKSLKMEGGVINYGGDNAKKLYSSVEQCDKEQKELQNIQYFSLTDATALNDILKKYEDFGPFHFKTTFFVFRRHFVHARRLTMVNLSL